MAIPRVIISSKYQGWSTPFDLYAALDGEFHFTDDPCPEGGIFGLDREWGERAFVNPPYGLRIRDWLEKGYAESLKGKTIVFLLPAHTSNAWFQDIVLPHAKEIRFCRGRLKFIDQRTGKTSGPAPFPSCIVIFQCSQTPNVHPEVNKEGR